MTQNKQKATTTNKQTKRVVKTKALVCDCADEKQQLLVTQEHVATMRTAEDFRNSILTVSVVINLFFLIAWVMLQVTTRYNTAVADLLFTR